MLGASNIGKTCLLQKWKFGLFLPKEKYNISTGIRKFTRRLIDGDNNYCEAEIWDSQGYIPVETAILSVQLQTQSLPDSYVICFDVSNRLSFKYAVDLTKKISGMNRNNLVYLLGLKGFIISFNFVISYLTIFYSISRQ